MSKIREPLSLDESIELLSRQKDQFGNMSSAAKEGFSEEGGNYILPLNYENYWRASSPIKSSLGDSPYTISPQKEDISKGKWKKVWYDFSQVTTLHGVNKITEDTPFTVRRIIWVLIVMFGTALFARQLVESVIYYRSWPVTVNVKINYNTTLTFPAVTICNQNDFRTTAAAAIGRYHLIRDFYTNLNTAGIDLEAYNATGVTLEDLYNATSHRKENMIVSCSWDNVACNEDDFVTTITDYGFCYTFNSGKTTGESLQVSTTGADRGLKVTLNIEQYEYMRGPSPGAGIKILIHDQNEEPLVGDLGQAIPPGSYAFAGIQIVKVHNLKPPHGVCDDQAQLEYSSSYSVSACQIECKMKFILSLCGCRDVYMPYDHATGHPPVCQLGQYQSCYQSAIYEFNKVNNCSCPVPCDRILFQNSISYASMSNYDVKRFLLSNGTDELRKRYVDALETRDRSEESIFAGDELLIRTFQNESSTLHEHVLGHYVKITNSVKRDLEEITSDLEVRMKFHVRWGLEKLHATADFSFVRGFEVMDERTFSLVTNNNQEITSYIAENIAAIADSQEDILRRKMLFEISMAQLSKIRVPANRALVNTTTFYDAYTNASRLVTWKLSPKRRFDETWVSTDIVRDDPEGLEANTEMFIKRTRQFIFRIDELENLLKEALFENRTDNATVQNTIFWFEKWARSFNYYRFRLRDIYSKRPIALTEAIRKRFDDARSYMSKTSGEMEVFFRNLLSSLKRADSTWEGISYFGDYCNKYLNGSASKMEIALLANSEETFLSKRELKSFITSLSSYSSDIENKLSTLQSAVTALWTNLINEHTLFKFYRKVAEDIELLSLNTPDNNEIVSAFAYMLETNKTFIMNNTAQLHRLLNGDILNITIKAKERELHEKFKKMRTLFLKTSDAEEKDDFFHAFDSLQNSLRIFSQNSNIDASFFRENFLQIDVFMSELSYEEIEQQAAYGLTNLWSDIGGSMGLFIGASVLTIFEVIDVIVHHFLQFYCCRRGRRDANKNNRKK